jgi:hypothetical protein
MAGRWWFGKKRTVEECFVLDVSPLRRKGLFQSGMSDASIWSWGVEPVATIGLRMEGWALVLRYSIVRHDGQKKDYDYRVPVVRTACHYGGSRPWFVCPGVVGGVLCNRRVAKLYKPPDGDLFLCRHCWNLSYESRREDQAGRMANKAQDIRRRLGGRGGFSEPFPGRPKGMHHKTYGRLREKAGGLEDAFSILVTRKYERILGRTEAEVERLELARLANDFGRKKRSGKHLRNNSG